MLNHRNDPREGTGGREKRRAERFPVPSIPVQLSEIDAEMIDLSLYGAAVLHRSPLRAGLACTLVFPSFGGIYVPCRVLRSVVQVRRGGQRIPEYVFRSALSFLPMSASEQGPLRDFLKIQIESLRAVQQGHEP